VLLLLVVTVGGAATLYYLGKAAYYDNFGKRGGLAAAAHIKPPRPGLAVIFAGLAPVFGMLGKVLHDVGAQTIGFEYAFHVLQSIASWFSVETAVANTVQSILHRRLQDSPIIRSYVPEPYKVVAITVSSWHD
jgi:hypothetical protein